MLEAVTKLAIDEQVVQAFFIAPIAVSEIVQATAGNAPEVDVQAVVPAGFGSGKVVFGPNKAVDVDVVVRTTCPVGAGVGDGEIKPHVGPVFFDALSRAVSNGQRMVRSCERTP